MVNFCLCLHDKSGTFYKNAVVTMASVMATCTQSSICYIFTDETVTDSHRSVFHSTATYYGQQVIFIDIPDDFEKFDVPEYWGVGCLYRVLITEMLQVEKVIYLDCDMVCNTDISKLFEMDMGGNYLAACRDLFELDLDRVRYTADLGIDPTKYFNAGLLVLNVKKISEDYPDFPKVIIKSILRKYRFLTQDPYNLFFRPEAVQLLDQKFNTFINKPDSLLIPLNSLHDKVLHFTRYKPWLYFSIPSLLYWKYYQVHFPDENVFDIMQNLPLPIDRYEHVLFLLKHKFTRRLVRRIYDLRTFGVIGFIKRRITKS